MQERCLVSYMWQWKRPSLGMVGVRGLCVCIYVCVCVQSVRAHMQGCAGTCMCAGARGVCAYMTVETSLPEHSKCVWGCVCVCEWVHGGVCIRWGWKHPSLSMASVCEVCVCVQRCGGCVCLHMCAHVHKHTWEAPAAGCLLTATAHLLTAVLHHFSNCPCGNEAENVEPRPGVIS